MMYHPGGEGGLAMTSCPRQRREALKNIELIEINSGLAPGGQLRNDGRYINAKDGDTAVILASSFSLFVDLLRTAVAVPHTPLSHSVVETPDA